MEGKKRNIKQRILNILFWSIISAAFIGPGTVTTMSKSGVYFHYDLMWTVVFSIIACLVLQEASARIAIFSGLNLGEAIAKTFSGKSYKFLVFTLIIGAIILGSAAYETGNILGAVEGLTFIFTKTNKIFFVLIIGILAFFAFRVKSIRTVAQFLGAFVYLMGLAFLLTAIFLKPDFTKIMHGLFIPTIPDVPGAGLLILGIIGTTVVPYDLFLGSSIVDKTQTIREARIGLSIAIILGGIISMSIMTVGSAITKGWTQSAINALDFNFSLIKDSLYLINSSIINDLAVYIFGFGIFAAGFTSAITAPLASALTTKSIFGGNPEKWKPKSLYFQLVAVGILLVGVTFGFLQIKPVPAIIMAQAFNGFILPFISVFMIIIVNDPRVMKEKINSHFSNFMMGFVLFITLLIGFLNVIKALQKIINFQIGNKDTFFFVLLIASLLLTIYTLLKVYKRRKKLLDEIEPQDAEQS